jgi:hypothetical protein
LALALLASVPPPLAPVSARQVSVLVSPLQASGLQALAQVLGPQPSVLISA